MLVILLYFDIKGKLSSCKYIFDQITANLAKIQPENHQNVPKMLFSFAKSPRSQWVNFRKHIKAASLKFKQGRKKELLLKCIPQKLS